MKYFEMENFTLSWKGFDEIITGFESRSVDFKVYRYIL